MIAWCKRPFEEANLLNPAFCGLVLLTCVRAYQKEKQQGMPFAVAFLALPIILHRKTRESLPKRLTNGNYVAPWLTQHTELRLGFAERVKGINPVVRESIFFLLLRNKLTIEADGRLVPSGKTIKVDTLTEQSPEIADCMSAANFVGKWLARGGSAANLYALWGIKP